MPINGLEEDQALSGFTARPLLGRRWVLYGDIVQEKFISGGP